MNKYKKIKFALTLGNKKINSLSELRQYCTINDIDALWKIYQVGTLKRWLNVHKHFELVSEIDKLSTEKISDINFFYEELDKLIKLVGILDLNIDILEKNKLIEEVETEEPQPTDDFFAPLRKNKKEINILILGETGVGKSTWINALSNYVMYQNLEEAEKNELRWAIPSSFTMTDENFEARKIVIGEDSNESFTQGQSATQEPRAYTFPCGDKTIRLIDTPGIGDTRGIDQDKENFAKILAFLANYDEIHGICILLKPNNARLGVMFRFCIKELLTHLHRSAAHNIIFYFTNTRNTFYKPGDTLPPLKKLLEENPNVEITLSKQTMYYMDNESFKFLAALKNGVVFEAEERDDYSASWNRSVKETARLLEYITSLKPHQTKDTLTLNDARRIILSLTKPIAEISKNVQNNIAALQEHKQDLSIKTKEQVHQETSKVIKKLESRTKQFEKEQNIITQASAKFACFLKQNAIAPYNDAMASYLDHLIREEEGKINAGGKRETFDGLQKMKQEYDEQVKILETAMNQSGNEVQITPDDIKELETKLLNLELSGENLKGILTKAKSGQSK